MSKRKVSVQVRFSANELLILRVALSEYESDVLEEYRFPDMKERLRCAEARARERENMATPPNARIP